MRLKSVLFVLGKILFAIAIILLVPTVCALIYKESPIPFLAPAGISLILGFLLTLNPHKKDRSLFAKDGFICVGFAWILVSLVGSLPFMFSPTGLSFADAFFNDYLIIIARTKGIVKPFFALFLYFSVEK